MNEIKITKKLIEDVIMSKLFDNDTYSGVMGNFQWRIIITSEGTELNLCKTEEFDRWANSNYIVIDPYGNWYEILNQISSIIIE